ncbi:MAG: hypothetical protein WAQ05_00320, partial [Rubrivivax sp.]
TPDPAPRPLVLDLPPSQQRQASAPERRRNPALDDARANSARPGSIESRIAGVTGDGRWRVEVLPDGRRMYRRGDECRMTQQARSSQLDPFNNAYFTPPPAAGPC